VQLQGQQRLWGRSTWFCKVPYIIKKQASVEACLFGTARGTLAVPGFNHTEAQSRNIEENNKLLAQVEDLHMHLH